ncbi:hypothetical protein VZT92_027838 [Zoarces viviparus]
MNTMKDENDKHVVKLEQMHQEPDDKREMIVGYLKNELEECEDVAADRERRLAEPRHRRGRDELPEDRKEKIEAVAKLHGGEPRGSGEVTVTAE